MTEKSSVVELQDVGESDINQTAYQQKGRACHHAIERLLPRMITCTLHPRIGGGPDPGELLVRDTGGHVMQRVLEQLDSVVILVRQPDVKHAALFQRLGRLEHRDACLGQPNPRIPELELTIGEKDLAHKAVW